MIKLHVLYINSLNVYFGKLTKINDYIINVELMNYNIQQIINYT
jgi:hypothetical protein